MVYIIGLIVALALIGLAIQYWYLSLLVVVAAISPRLIRHIRMKRYFGSAEFIAQKAEIAAVVAEHNEVSEYVDEIRTNGQFSIGHSASGAQSQLASTQNTSKYGYKRDRNVLDFSSENVHTASLQVVRNASIEPIKYLIKYFEIEANEEKLSEIELLGESVSKLENAIQNAKSRELSISSAIAPPGFILKHYLNEFRAQVGLSVPELEIPYPKYKFQYVSAGGNSSQTTEIKLNSETIDSIIETLSQKIKFRQSVAGQRALMTANLRERIKSRDEFKCQICEISTRDEEHLLLEVDHIKPVSKGGLSIETNLQTLCWKCNRTKSNKEINPGK